MNDNSLNTAESLSPVKQLTRSDEPGRNELCKCGSGLKFKKCHGDEVKRQKVTQFASMLFVKLIQFERMKAGIAKWPFQCQACKKGFLHPATSEIVRGTPMCPECMSLDIIRNNDSPFSGDKDAGLSIPDA